MVDVTVPSGALSERRKAGLVEAVTELILEKTGWGEGAGVRVWTLIHEGPDGNWGAAGQVVRFEQLRTLPGPSVAGGLGQGEGAGCRGGG